MHTRNLNQLESLARKPTINRQIYFYSDRSLKAAYKPEREKAGRVVRCTRLVAEKRSNQVITGNAAIFAAAAYFHGAIISVKP